MKKHLSAFIAVVSVLPAFEPGSKYEYSNSGINTAGRIIEVVSGMPYEEFMAKRLFAPLGMKDTTFWPTKAQFQRLANAYKQTADNKGLEEIPTLPTVDPHTGRKSMAFPASGDQGVYPVRSAS